MKSLLLALLATGTLFAGEKLTLTLADFTDLNVYIGPSSDKSQAESLLWLKELKVIP